MAEGGDHSATCANASPGSICDCDCGGAYHAVAVTGGRPAAGGVTERARRAAAAAGRAVVVTDRDGGRVASTERRPRIPPAVLERARRVRDRMPNTANAWRTLGDNMARNEHGRPTPNAAQNRHLDEMMEVGRGVLGAARAEFDRDPDIQAARRRIAADQAARAHFAASYNQVRERRGLSQRSREQEFVRLKRETAEMRRAAGIDEDYDPSADRRTIRRRESAILREMVGAARPMGGINHDVVYLEQNENRPDARGARPDADARLNAAEEFYPEDWLNRSSAYPIRLTSSDRAYYLEQSSGGLLAMPTTGRDRSAYDGAFSDHTAEVTVHELGHRMETMVPGLREMEFTMVRRRATTDSGAAEDTQPLRQITRSPGFGAEEVAYRDDWANPYAGRTYEAYRPLRPDQAPWELFQVGMQETFGRGSNRFDNRDDLQAFTLGALMTLGRL